MITFSDFIGSGAQFIMLIDFGQNWAKIHISGTKNAAEYHRVTQPAIHEVLVNDATYSEACPWFVVPRMTARLRHLFLSV